MFKFFVIIALVLLNGCASTVHLISQGYNETQLSNISKQIQELGFNVEHSVVDVPAHYPNAVLALNPAHSVSDDIPKLQQMLHALDIAPAQELRFGSNKHFYNDGHIGLYLRHPDINPSAAMPPYLESVNCPTGYATLAFAAKQQLYLETGKNVKGELQLTTTLGRWFFNGEILSITLNQHAVAQFGKSEVTRETALGPRPALLFTPTTLKHQSPALKCQFEVVFMD